MRYKRKDFDAVIRKSGALPIKQGRAPLSLLFIPGGTALHIYQIAYDEQVQYWHGMPMYDRYTGHIVTRNILLALALEYPDTYLTNCYLLESRLQHYLSNYNIDTINRILSAEPYYLKLEF